jgi:Na+-translocating ferredoxin:NAD+ oxidoreductase RnfG subunit
MWMKSPAVWLPASFVLGPLVVHQAHCEVYMDQAQAAGKIFPGLSFKRAEVKLTADEIKKIESSADDSVRGPDMIVWQTSGGERVYIDQVLGKHEFITYAVGVDAKGVVKGIEILEYRESYGQKVRDDSWRAQFAGKDRQAPLKLNKDIKNISGATLSSAHITSGVRRVLQTHDVIQRRG